LDPFLYLFVDYILYLTTINSWYCEEEYIQHIKKSFAQVVKAEGDEAVSWRKEFNDVDQANDLSIIVGITRELIMLLKCI